MVLSKVFIYHSEGSGSGSLLVVVVHFFLVFDMINKITRCVCMCVSGLFSNVLVTSTSNFLSR